MSTLLSLLGLLCCLFIGCTRAPPAGDNCVPSIICSKINQEVHWNQGSSCDEEVCCAIQCMIQQELSVDSAIQIALLNNPEVQAVYEEVGIAQADLVEAGLFTNPIFEIEVRYPHAKRLHTNIEYLVTATFLDIFLIPLKTRLASTELDQAKLRVANAILNLSYEVRNTYYALLAEQQMLKYTRAIAELTSIQTEVATRQNQVGNVFQLYEEQFQSKSLKSDMKIDKSQAQIIHLKEKLNRLLGLCDENCLLLPERLPEEVDYRGFDVCVLEAIALQERIDLQVARYDVIRFSQMLGLKDWWTYSNLNIGLAGEREPDGANLLGFGLQGELPIFNFGQAARMRLFAQLRQSQDRLVALEIRALSEVRQAHNLLMTDLKIINNYRMRILPLERKILSSSEELYNVMGLGVDSLLMSKQQEIETFRNYLESLKDYWIARVMLDTALGGNFYRLLFPDCVGVVE